MIDLVLSFQAKGEILYLAEFVGPQTKYFLLTLEMTTQSEIPYSILNILRLGLCGIVSMSRRSGADVRPYAFQYGQGVRRLGDGPADDQVSGTGMQGRRRGHGAALVLGGRAVGTDTRRHQAKIGTEARP